MGKPIVAIVGRPNVGKSTLFNSISGERIAIVEDVPGVTRDRIYADAEWLGVEMSLIDTGGIDIGSDDSMLVYMREQADIAIENADVILFVTDVKQGLTDDDVEVANMLRKSGTPIVLAVNKVDNFDTMMADVYEFYNLGLGEPYPVSASSRLGLGDMLDAILAEINVDDFDNVDDDIPKIAIVGKPNSGKSSLVNRLLGENRVIVSDVAGTTRDAIDTRVKNGDNEYIFTDTAGLRRKSKIKERLERYSIIRTVAAIERSDMVILMIDATEGITEQDAKIAGISHEAGRGLIIAVNKWDLIEKDNHTVNEFTDKIRQVLSFVPYAEIVFISAKTGQRVKKLYDLIDQVVSFQTLRIQTGVLNEILYEAMNMQQPPSDKGKRLKIFYMTQVSVSPPVFVMFVNKKELMHFSYARYIENRLRDTFGFTGTPIKLITRERKEKD